MYKRQVCTLGTIAAGDSVVITIVGTVDPSTTATQLVNGVSLTTDTEDPDGVPPTDEIVVDVSPQADLEMTKEGPDSAVAGESFIYTLTVVNHGVSDAQNVVVTDSLPDGLVYDDGGSTPACPETAPGSGVVLCLSLIHI